MEIQTIIHTQTIKSCAFTGHRELESNFPINKLEREIEKLINDGICTFYNGGARGFDLLSAEIILRLKEKYTQIRLILCVPCLGQEKYYSEQDKKRYQEIYKKADETIIISENYTRFCLLQRDKYMADYADVLLAYKRKETGGTAYTVGYFVKKYPYKRVVFI